MLFLMGVILTKQRMENKKRYKLENYVQGWYDQTVVQEENDANLQKYEKYKVINVNVHLIVIHHQFFILGTV